MATVSRRKKHQKKKSNEPLRVGETILKSSRSAAHRTKNFIHKANVLFNRESIGKGLRLKGLSFGSFLIGFSVLILLMLFVANTRSIEVDNVTVSIPGLPDELEGYRILVLSDLHGESLGDEQTSLLRTINGLSYDLVLITGDMVGKDGDPEPFYQLLDGMTANRKTFFIAGDSDPGPLLDKPRDIEVGKLEEYVLEDWILGAEERGAVYLDEPMSFAVDGVTVWLTPAYMLSINASDEMAKLKLEYNTEAEAIIEGEDSFRAIYPFTAYRYARMQTLYASLSQMGENDLHLSLSHIPVTLEYVTTAQQNSSVIQDDHPSYLRMVDMVMAGHYCGGVWNIPLYGALYIPNESAPRYGWLPDQDDVQGLTAMNSAYQYVSAGLGCTDAVKVPSFRLFNNSQVTVITLTATLTELK